MSDLKLLLGSHNKDNITNRHLPYRDEGICVLCDKPAYFTGSMTNIDTLQMSAMPKLNEGKVVGTECAMEMCVVFTEMFEAVQKAKKKMGKI